MTCRALGLAALCTLSTGAFADTGRDQIATDRAVANATFAQQQRECEARFIVARCLEEARNDHRAALAQLRQLELTLDESRRHAAAQARRKAIADKVDAQQTRAGDAEPEAPSVRVRREAPALVVRAGEVAMPASAEDRGELERRNQAKFEARARQAQAHRDAVARRNAQHAAQGKTAAPLAVPPGASAPR